VLSQEQGTITQQKPSTGEMKRTLQRTLPVDLRDDGVDIDLLSPEEIEGALKYLKNNKAASTESIAAEFLKTVDLIWWIHYMN
jgi:hypothetical protein